MFAFIKARKATEKESHQLIGICKLYKRKYRYEMCISDRILRRGETNIYSIHLSRKFVSENYLEELVIKVSERKKSYRVERKIIL